MSQDLVQISPLDYWYGFSIDLQILSTSKPL